MSDAEYTASVVADEPGLRALRHEWDELLEGSAENRPFSTWTWASCWWDHHRAGKRLYIVTLRDGEGRLAGLAPFYCEWLLPGLPVRRLRLMGAGNSDYLDLIFTRGQEGALAKGLIGYLAAHGRAWQLLTLEEVPGDSPALAAIRRVAESAAWPSVLSPQEVCPYLELPGTWEELRSTLGKKTRKHLDYYRRRLEKESQFEIRLVEDPADLPGAMDEMFRLHQRRWRRRGMPGSFALASVRRFHLDVARRFLGEGRLRLYLAYA
ncbi:MAG: GNAT family N-acetyltransferase, partial [Bacillota bacterium]